ncbi:MAG: TrmO family methyltransferase [bacterium]|nr:TrmO family methyltransferase [bacterium]
MFRMKRIGVVEKQGQQLQVKIDCAYKKAMKHMEAFSHIHLFVIAGNQTLTRISAKISDIDFEDGKLSLEWRNIQNRVADNDFPLDLIDIKPYMPSEDFAHTDDHGGMNTGIGVQADASLEAYTCESIGEIRNTQGVTYLLYQEDVRLPEKLGTYVHVIWWFDKYDDTGYRRILQCETPYESEGKMGVFACRAPVRPNPIAVTTVQVKGIDYENHRIYIHGIEAFDHTALLGIIDYDVSTDRVLKEEVVLPEWAGNWPDAIAVAETSTEDIEALIRELDGRRADGRETGFVAAGEEKDEDTKDDKSNRQRPTHIVVTGARENNLKGISVSIPYGKITAVVGVSGSGKSSLVMDTVYAECQRRMEQLNSENSLRPRPEMESMTGCMPVVMISQKEIRTNSNSTIGTFSGINHHLRCIYAAIGKRNYIDPKQVAFKLTPATFSFLDPECRCPACNGKGRKHIPDIKKIITMPEKSLLMGASPFLGKLKNYIENPNANWMKGQVVALAREMGVDLSKPWEELPKEFRETVLYGDTTKEVSFVFDNKKTGRRGEINRIVEGIFPIINRTYIEDDKGGMSKKYMSDLPCEVCGGERLAPEGRLVSVLGVRFPIAAGLDFAKLRRFALAMKQRLSKGELQLIEEHVDAIITACDTAEKLGIEYLELNREPSTLSGGEAQRLKLLSAFGNHMTGILYIFDEPSKKLSQKEYDYIIGMMRELIDDGNTVLMVEHNMDLIKIADYVIEIGPKAGNAGGYLMAEGTYEDVTSHNNSMLGKYAVQYDWYDRRERASYSSENTSYFGVEHVNANNLHDVSVTIPKAALTCITGVSGSGKSTLLYQGILQQMEKSNTFDQVVLVESKIAGGSSRSVIATYIGIMDDIRQMFALSEAAVAAGFCEKDFSFNTGSLRCEHCGGDGRIKIPYTQDSYGVCPVCHGKRYNKRVEEICCGEKSITQVLALSVDEAVDFFTGRNDEIAKKCALLVRVGLSYLTLGHSTGILSGGEAARLKIASCLMNANMKNSLFLLDEPTCGLHFSDIDNLITLLYEMIDSGNTVVAIEHNKRFLSAADYTIVMGPGAGENGGRVQEIIHADLHC